MTTKLKPCPFCGVVPAVGVTGVGTYFVGHKCRYVDGRRPAFTEEAAAKAWNTRPGEKIVEEEFEEDYKWDSWP